MIPQLIVSAANRHTSTGIIITGARHFDHIMIQQIKAMNLPDKIFEQGFIDQKGNFLTREEAYIIAKDAGQIRRRCGGDEGRLFSENLY